MSYTITRLSSSSFDALSDDEISEFLRIDPDTDALTVAMLFASATAYVEAYTSQTISTATYRVVYHDRCSTMRLPLYPVQSVTSVTYLDDQGVAQPISYTLSGNTLRLNNRPDRDAAVTVVAGYASEEAIPASIKHALAVLVSAGYDDRAGMSEAVEKGVSRLLMGCRRGGWLA